MEPLEVISTLGIALAIGLLIGLERGWYHREAGEGQRVAGLRTYGLIGLMGGVWALLAEEVGLLLLGFAFLALTVVLVVAHYGSATVSRDYGITSEVAALLTFTLGALAASGYPQPAAAGAVVTAILLGTKDILHGWVARLERFELIAALQLLLISVVVLPVLPNRGFGPWEAINPFLIWWLVVLIAVISFLGHFAMRLIGPKGGIMLTGLFGGLASSTALTLSFSRLGREYPELQKVLTVAVVLAAATMFPRMLVEVSIVNPALIREAAPPLVAMALTGFLVGGVLWFAGAHQFDSGSARFHAPFRLATALKFGVLLVIIMFLARAAEALFGEAGLFALAAVSGLTDVDAITLSLSHMARDEISHETAVRGMLFAAITNTVIKGGLVVVLCGGTMAWRFGVAALAVAGVGGFFLLVPDAVQWM